MSNFDSRDFESFIFCLYGIGNCMVKTSCTFSSGSEGFIEGLEGDSRLAQRLGCRDSKNFFISLSVESTFTFLSVFSL